jgi:hypothetical protein
MATLKVIEVSRTEIVWIQTPNASYFLITLIFVKV